MTLARGGIYANATPGGHAARLLVLSEDDWNRVIKDGVGVPIFDRGPEQAPSLMLVGVSGDLFADCTKIQTIAAENWGAPVGACPAELLCEIENGVRAFLTLSQLRAKRAPASAKAPPSPADWWPHRGPGPIRGPTRRRRAEDAWRHQRGRVERDRTVMDHSAAHEQGKGVARSVGGTDNGRLRGVG